MNHGNGQAGAKPGSGGIGGRFCWQSRNGGFKSNKTRASSVKGETYENFHTDGHFAAHRGSGRRRRDAREKG
jgi:hypothetical protein